MSISCFIEAYGPGARLFGMWDAGQGAHLKYRNTRNLPPDSGLSRPSPPILTIPFLYIIAV